MKKTMLTLAAAVLGAGMAAVPAFAQDAAPPAAAHGGGHRANPMTAATANLALTPDQQKTVDAAQADAMTKMKALRDDTSTDQTAKRKQMMQIQKDSMDKVRAVLTDDQKTKFDANIAQAREQAKAQHGGGEGAAPPAGAPPAGAPPSDN